MTTPDDVLRAMAEAIDPHNCNWANGLPGPLKAQAFRQAERALTAAEQAGWVLVLASEHERLSDRVAALDEPYVDDRGEHWRAPTAHAYAAVCKALRTCKAERDAARAAAPKVTP